LIHLLFADVNVHWYLPPLVIAVSLVYSGTRFEGWGMILSHAVRWAVYILTFLAGAYVFLYLVSLDLQPVWYIPIVGAALALLFYSGRQGGRTPH
jgi:hypothetical protein